MQLPSSPVEITLNYDSDVAELKFCWQEVSQYEKLNIPIPVVIVSIFHMNITRLCLNDTESIIWYDVCMLRYSNGIFNNIVPGFPLKDEGSIISSKLDQFNELLAGLLSDLATKAGASSTSEKKFAAGEVGLTSMQRLYGVAQCVPELTSSDCVACFRNSIAGLPSCCNGSQGAWVLLPGCNIRYQLYSFLYNTTSMPHLFLPLLQLEMILHMKKSLCILT